MLRTATGVGGRFSSGNAALRGLLRRAGRFARPPASAEGFQAATPRRGAPCGGRDASHGYQRRLKGSKRQRRAEGEAPSALPMEGATRAPIIGGVAEWTMAAVLKTVIRKDRGFESYPLRPFHTQKNGTRLPRCHTPRI